MTVREMIKTIRREARPSSQRDQVLTQLRFFRKYNISLNEEDTKEFITLSQRLRSKIKRKVV